MLSFDSSLEPGTAVELQITLATRVGYTKETFSYTMPIYYQSGWPLSTPITKTPYVAPAVGDIDGARSRARDGRRRINPTGRSAPAPLVG